MENGLLTYVAVAIASPIALWALKGLLSFFFESKKKKDDDQDGEIKEIKREIVENKKELNTVREEFMDRIGGIKDAINNMKDELKSDIGEIKEKISEMSTRLKFHENIILKQKSN